MKIFVASFLTWAFINRVIASSNTYTSSQQSLNLEDEQQLKELERLFPASLGKFQFEIEQGHGDTGKYYHRLGSSNAVVSSSSFSTSSARSKHAASSAIEKSDAAGESRAEEKAPRRTGEDALKEAPAAIEMSNRVKSDTESKSVAEDNSPNKNIVNHGSDIEISLASADSRPTWHSRDDHEENEMGMKQGNKRVITKTYITKGPVRRKSWSWTTKVNNSSCTSFSEEIHVLREQQQRMEARVRTETEAREKAELEVTEVRRQLKLKVEALQRIERKAREEAEARAKAEALLASESKELAVARDAVEASSKNASFSQLKAQFEIEARSQLQFRLLSILRKRSIMEEEVEITEEVKKNAHITAERSTAASTASKEAAKAIRIAVMARANAAIRALAAQRASFAFMNNSYEARIAISTLSAALEQAIVCSKAAVASQTEASVVANALVKAAVAEGTAIDYAQYRIALLKNVTNRMKVLVSAAADANAAAAVAVSKLEKLQMNSQGIARNAAEAQEAAALEAETAFTVVNMAAKEEMVAQAKMDVETSVLEAAAAALVRPLQGVRNGVVLGLGMIDGDFSEMQAKELKKAAGKGSGDQGKAGWNIDNYKESLE